LIPKLYPYLVFHTLLGLHPYFLQDLNSCFGTWIFNPSPSIDFESPFDSYCSITINFLQLLYTFDLSPYNLYRLDLHLMLPKNLQIKIFKNIYILFQILTSIESNALNKFKILTIFFLFLFFFKNCLQFGPQSVSVDFTSKLLFAYLKIIQIILSIVLSTPTICCFNSFKIIFRLYSLFFIVSISLFPHQFSTTFFIQN
jgi:hypothetical protein